MRSVQCMHSDSVGEASQTNDFFFATFLEDSGDGMVMVGGEENDNDKQQTMGKKFATEREALNWC